MAKGLYLSLALGAAALLASNTITYLYKDRQIESLKLSHTEGQVREAEAYITALAQREERYNKRLEEERQRNIEGEKRLEQISIERTDLATTVSSLRNTLRNAETSINRAIATGRLEVDNTASFTERVELVAGVCTERYSWLAGVADEYREQIRRLIEVVLSDRKGPD